MGDEAKTKERLVEELAEMRRTIAELEGITKFPGENPHPVMRVSRDGTIITTPTLHIITLQ